MPRPVPNLTVSTIQPHATDKSYERGAASFRSGAVVALTQRQQTLQTDWPNLQGKLLQHLRTGKSWGLGAAPVDIFLHGELLEDAIAAVSDLSDYQGNLVLRVMDAVVDTHSQWVIDNACPGAESIMDGRKAKYYHHAVDWLKRVKAAYHTLGKTADWSRYRQELFNTHGRKRKLIGLIQQGKL